MPRRLTGVLTAALLAAAPSGAGANGEPGSGGPPTVFERFVLSVCTPCVRESYPVAALRTPAVPLPAAARATPGAASRPGEIVIEVLRARQPGRPAWTSLALRVTLAVTSGPGGDTFRLGVGLLDAADGRALAQAVTEMATLATASPGNPGAETVDVDFHGGSLRIGLLRVRGDAVGYVQTGDLPTLLQRAVWEVPTTLYLPVTDLPALGAALGQAAATIDRVRGN